MKAYQIVKKNQETTRKLKRSPWLFVSAFGSHRQLNVFGDMISFGEDYLSLEEARTLVEYLTDELGGNVKWNTSSKKPKKGE